MRTDKQIIQEDLKEAVWVGEDGDAIAWSKTQIGAWRKIRALMLRLGRQADFARYLESVKAAHKQKRNFMKRLERVKWQ